MRLVQIGNSKGVRIPKLMIQKAGLEGCELELRFVDGGILLSPVRSPPRQGWESAAINQRNMGGDEAPLLTGTNDFDTKEWTW
ncbi:MAG: AbrB/MazE/SpoVT family DNA-binding domain-containing protein [Magnetococcales bacterium]|nr:AbrB/MazE/SpoVT family DNA-binding domain-containing protein [Magnetococcales bacterium]